MWFGVFGGLFSPADTSLSLGLANAQGAKLRWRVRRIEGEKFHQVSGHVSGKKKIQNFESFLEEKEPWGWRESLDHKH